MKKIFIAAWATCTIAFGAAAQSGGLLSLLDEQYSLDRVTNALARPSEASQGSAPARSSSSTRGMQRVA